MASDLSQVWGNKHVGAGDVNIYEFTIKYLFCNYVAPDI
jgi:hypothetical protein